MNKAVIIQGPNTYPDEIIKSYSGVDVIFSTLNNENTEQLNDSGFIILKNVIPEFNGRANFNYQVRNTFNGLLRAKEMGYKYAFKVRSDVIIPEIARLLEIMGEPKNKIYFSAYHNWDGGYLCEHMLYGEIDLLLALWNIPISYSNLPPETQLTKNFISKLGNVDVDYIFPILYQYNIEAFWLKRNFYLNEYINDKLFTYEEFKK